MNSKLNLSRLPINRNLFIYNSNHFNNMPIFKSHAPFVFNYLSKIEETIHKALDDQPRTLAVRVELKLPLNYNWQQDHKKPLCNRFIDSLKAKISSRRMIIQRSGTRVHKCNVHYLWTREYSTRDNVHYHFALLLNNHTFNYLGEYSSESTGLYGLICQAWGSALGISRFEATSFVHIPENATYILHRNEPFDELFTRVSYFAKLKSKRHGDGRRNFGSSR